MRRAYDSETDSGRMHSSDIPVTDSEEVVGGVVPDFNPSGALMGIDVQHASRKADVRRLSISHLPLLDLNAG